jgi:hypothetical protein
VVTEASAAREGRAAREAREGLAETHRRAAAAVATSGIVGTPEEEATQRAGETREAIPAETQAEAVIPVGMRALAGPRTEGEIPAAAAIPVVEVTSVGAVILEEAATPVAVGTTATPGLAVRGTRVAAATAMMAIPEAEETTVEAIPVAEETQAAVRLAGAATPETVQPAAMVTRAETARAAAVML